MDTLKDMLLTQVANSEMRLNIALDALEDDYDSILIDCPPDLSQILDNALLASQRVLLPVQAMRRSIRAVEKMNDEITYLESSFPGQVDSIDILGIIVNQVEDRPNNDTKQMLEFFYDSRTLYLKYLIASRSAVLGIMGCRSSGMRIRRR